MPDLTTYDHDIFLSHNHKDQEWTARLAERLEKENWEGRRLKVFFSPWDIRPGQSIPKEVERGLEKSRKVGLIMSPDAIESAWVELERLVTTHIAVTARDERLIPLYLHTTEIPGLLRPILPIDFRNDEDFEDSYQTLLAVIKDEPLARRSRIPTPASVPSALIPRPPVVGFVARRDSEGRDIVQRLKEELAPEKNQLIALSGPGGVGKTMLAAEAVRALSSISGNRIVWTSALGREDYSLSTLLDEIATQLGQPGLRTLPALQKGEQVQALIASAPMLIILDNFETIAEVQQTRCVEYLLTRASCPALITTRQRIPSARNITIPAMSSDEANTFLQLLIEQAGDSSRFATLNRDQIMIASERNPLVMQWVVGQIDLAQDTETVLHELAHGVGDAAQRVFDRSFELEQLGDDGRATLLALSLFAPDASRVALAEVAGFVGDSKRLNDAVKRLAGMWLVRTSTFGQRLTVAGLTRELAEARLSRHESANEFRERFVEYFLTYTAERSLPTPENFDALELEKDNLLTAMDLALEIKDFEGLQEIAYPLVKPQTGMLSVRGYWDEAIQRGQEALKAAKATDHHWYVGAFANGLGAMFSNQGNYLLAKQHYQLAVEMARRLNEEQGLAATLLELGRLAYSEGEADEARRLYYESLEISKRLNHQTTIASNLHNLGVIAQDEDSLEEARRLYQESFEISKGLGDQRAIATSLHQLATLAQDQGEIDEARRLCTESMEISRKLGDQDGISSGLFQLARMAQAQGELDEARKFYNESLRIAKNLGDQNGIAIALHQLGRLAENEGKNAEAVRLFGEALTILEKLKSPTAEMTRQSLERVTGQSS